MMKASIVNEITDEEYQRLSNYAIIGDCHTAALVGQNGSIDWFCPLRFDSRAVFCRLIDAKKGGYCSISPSGSFSTERQYLAGTNILKTSFIDREKRVTLTDFMPVHRRLESGRGHDVGTSRRILRLVEGEDGEMELRVRFHPTFDYARTRTRSTVLQPNIALATGEGKFLSIACPGQALSFASDDRGGVTGYLKLKAGERCWLVLTDSDDPDRAFELPSPSQCEEQLSRTLKYWNEWSKKCTYRGPYREMVLRSALTLKLLTYEPTGAIIAAPTASLPEEIGGTRNWDYRYAWLRDSALILYALVTIGYEQEAADFFEWLQATHEQDPNSALQVMYGIDGRRDLREEILDNLEGYRRSRPVRIGNGAAGQLQLDIYGEVLTAAYLYFKTEIGKTDGQARPNKQRVLQDDWPLLKGLVERAAMRWKEPDNGIWEVRGGRQHFLYSKLMCWAALDRGIRLASECSLPAPGERWLNTREAIEKSIQGEGFNLKLGAFTQALNSTSLDASALIIPRVGFLPPTDSRVQSTLARIETDLMRGGLVYRYTAEDGLEGSEGAFATCTFWLVDVLSSSGQVEKAERLFKHATSFANDVGLLSEEIDPSSGDLLGNFPQGFTHMALINAAVNLEKARRHGPEEYPETEVERAAKARHMIDSKDV